MDSLLKSLVLRAISKGLRLPQAHIDRVNELSYLRDLLSQLAIDCVLDVGANRGQYAKELRAIGYEGRIVSFEPIASEFAVMKEHFASDVRWKGIQIALGSATTVMNLKIPKLTVMSSLLDSVNSKEPFHEERVEVKRLNDVLPSLLAEFGGPSRLFLKMDTQGFDLEVFRGADGVVAQILGLQSELSIQPLYKKMPNYLEALAAYGEKGFVLYNLSVVNRVGNGGLLELNCFMRR